ncbi:MAG: DUF5694 domain-containing protein [Balneolaceae bacterium]|nr:DUF5694 domain-containing protein [Balneolaceae bacterium]
MIPINRTWKSYVSLINFTFLRNFSGLTLLLILLCGTTYAQDGDDTSAAEMGQEKIQVMILGTSHFGNPGQDVINTEFPDVKLPKYQRQIRQVVDSLAEFKPTKVALEARPDYRAEMDSMYRAWLGGEHELTRNERQQLGFRLAGRMGHSRLYGIDYEGEFPFRAVIRYAKEHQPEFIREFDSIRRTVKQVDDSLYANATIREILRYNNGKESLSRQRNYYAKTAAVGDDSTWVGVDLVTQWHRRNIQIFAKLARVAEPGDRVAVIFGSGHAPLLRYFVESSRNMELVDPLDWL